MCKSLNMACDVLKCLPMLLIAINYSHGTAEPLCQSDWTYYNERCYMLVRSKVSHSSAQAGCRGMEATLATIGDEEEHDFLNTIDESREVWIGLTKRQHDCQGTNLACQRSNWMWADETPYRYPEFHKWGNTDPTSDELCARINPAYAGLWYGIPCAHPYAYICEKGTLSTTSKTTTAPPTTTSTTSTTVTPLSTTSTTTVTSTSTTSTTTVTPTSTTSTTTAIPTSMTTSDPASTTDDSATTTSSDAVVTIALNSLMTLSSDEHQAASSSNVATEQSSLQSKYETVKLVVIVVYSVLGVLLLTIAVEVFILYRRHELPWHRDDVTKDDVSITNTE